jgi:nicotinate-nucleotide pyrophosphorylase (carboxylating)
MVPDWDGPAVAKFISRALAEDVGPGDLTSQTLFPDPPVISAHFLAKEAGILCGMPLVTRIFQKLDPDAKIEISTLEGQTFSVGSILGRITAKATALLAGERLALNLIQRLSAISTQTALYAALATPFEIKVLDTRKTTPLMRIFEKYAVTTGGGTNHRIGLHDGILVKDNHLKLQPDFKKVIESFVSKGFSIDQVEIEVTSLIMLKKAMQAGAVWFLLDNMRPSLIRRCVKIKRPNMRYEVSGGITPRNFTKYLMRGVDAISIGALTHSVKSLDISLEME